MISHYENVIEHKKKIHVLKKNLCEGRWLFITVGKKSPTGVSYVSRNDSSPAGLLMGVACVHR